MLCYNSVHSEMAALVTVGIPPDKLHVILKLCVHCTLKFLRLCRQER